MNKGLIFAKKLDRIPRFVAGVILTASICLFHPAAANDDFTLTVCNSCSTSFTYSAAALDAAKFENPFAIETQSDEVYVVNLNSGVVQYYLVRREFIDPNPTVLGDETFRTTATAGSGDPAVLGDIRTAKDALNSLLHFLAEDIDAEDLHLSFPSALDLVGSYDSQAGLNRNALQNILQDRARSFSTGFGIIANDTISRIIDRFLGTGIIAGTDFVVAFQDGTMVTVEVTQVSRDATDGDKFIVTYDVKENTVRGPGMPAAPQTPGQLSGFTLSTPDTDLASALRRLILRLGISFSGDGGSPPQGQCSITTCVQDPQSGAISCTQSIGPC